jgi:hypothetical protein
VLLKNIFLMVDFYCAAKANLLHITFAAARAVLPLFFLEPGGTRTTIYGSL